MAEAAAVCLEDQGHPEAAHLAVQGGYTTSFRLIRPSVTEQMRRSYNDAEVATENGAYGVAILLIRELAGFTVVEKSRKGTGFDYWLGRDEEHPFQNKARLEVSGIRRGDDNTVRARVNEKRKQTRRSDPSLLQAYVIIVEFSRPLAHVVQR
jgi:hypothetical protein